MKLPQSFELISKPLGWFLYEANSEEVTNKVQKALNFTIAAHHGQMRNKIEPYHNHPIRVASMTAIHAKDVAVVCSALLHDVVEDTNVTHEQIRDEFGTRVAYLVHELTNQYTKQNYPQMNRAERKRLEAERLGRVSYGAQLVKAFDIYDNARGIYEYDAKFAPIYLRESEVKLAALSKIDPIIRARVVKIIQEARDG